MVLPKNFDELVIQFKEDRLGVHTKELNRIGFDSRTGDLSIMSDESKRLTRAESFQYLVGRGYSVEPELKINDNLEYQLSVCLDDFSSLLKNQKMREGAFTYKIGRDIYPFTSCLQMCKFIQADFLPVLSRAVKKLANVELAKPSENDRSIINIYERVNALFGRNGFAERYSEIIDAEIEKRREAAEKKKSLFPVVSAPKVVGADAVIKEARKSMKEGFFRCVEYKANKINRLLKDRGLMSPLPEGDMLVGKNPDKIDWRVAIDRTKSPKVQSVYYLQDYFSALEMLCLSQGVSFGPFSHKEEIRKDTQSGQSAALQGQKDIREIDTPEEVCRVVQKYFIPRLEQAMLVAVQKEQRGISSEGTGNGYELKLLYNAIETLFGSGGLVKKNAGALNILIEENKASHLKSKKFAKHWALPRDSQNTR